MAYPRNEDDQEAQIAADKLRGFVGEIERSDDRIKSENSHKSDIFKNAKKEGFNVKALRKVIAARRMDEVDRSKLDNDFELYMMHLEWVAHAHVEIIDEIDDDEPDHDPITGEVIETAASVEQSAVIGGEGPALALPVDPIESTATGVVATATVAVELGGEGVTALSAEPAPVKRSARPHCLNPKACGSSKWNQHCFTCQKTLADAEGFAA